MKRLAAALAIALLPACTVALHGEQSPGGGATAAVTSSSVKVGAGGNNYALGASFGRALPPTAPGGYLSVSTGSAAAALVLGIVLVNAIDYLSGAPGGRVWAGTAASRPIAHTCSCYGYRPDEDPRLASE